MVTAARFRGAAGVRDGARGWNADQFGRHRLPLLVRPFGAGNAVAVEDRSVGTLLGPEGAGPPGKPGGCFLCRGRPVPRTAAAPRGGCGSGGGVRAVTGRTLRTAQWTRASSEL